MKTSNLVVFVFLALFVSPAFASNMSGTIIFISIPVAVACLLVSMLIAEKARTKKGIIGILILQIPNFCFGTFTVVRSFDASNIIDIAFVASIGVLCAISSLIPIIRFRQRLNARNRKRFG